MGFNSAFKVLKPTCYVMHQTGLTFNNCMLCPHCIYVFCIYLRTNSDLCHLLHKLIGFYNQDEKCLQRGTDWVFKYSSLRFVFEWIKIHSFHSTFYQSQNHPNDLYTFHNPDKFCTHFSCPLCPLHVPVHSILLVLVTQIFDLIDEQLQVYNPKIRGLIFNNNIRFFFFFIVSIKHSEAYPAPPPPLHDTTVFPPHVKRPYLKPIPPPSSAKAMNTLNPTHTSFYQFKIFFPTSSASLHEG